MKANRQDHEELPDDLNPAFIFNCTSTEILLKAVSGEISLDHLARKSLADRGLDLNTGEWVGFPEAEKQLKGWEAQNVA